MEFTKRDTSVIKGFAICLMLWHHLFTFPERLVGVEYISLPFIDGETLAYAIGQFGKICVALFALLSGYGTYLSSKKAAPDKIISRHLLRMYKSYWSIFFIAVPVSFLLGLPQPDPFLKDLIYGAIGLSFSYCNEWWFITPLALLLIMSPIIWSVVDRPKSTVLSNFFGLILVNAFILYVLPTIARQGVFSKLEASFFWLEFYTTLTLLPAYVLGALFAKYDGFAFVKAKFANTTGSALCSLIVLAALFLIHPFNWIIYDFINAALFICCILILLSVKPLKYFYRIFEELGKESTYIWLIHALLCYHWCQKLVFAPKFSILIFLWLLALSFSSAKLIRFVYKYLGILYRKTFKTA